MVTSEGLRKIRGVFPQDCAALAQDRLGLAWNWECLHAARRLRPGKLVENGLRMFLQMVFVDGLYHGYLHTGNILALTGNRIGLGAAGILMLYVVGSILRGPQK